MTDIKTKLKIGDLALCNCGKVATQHHRGRHYCEEHAKIHASKCKRVVYFWFTPKGAQVEALTYEGKPIWEAVQ